MMKYAVEVGLRDFPFLTEEARRNMMRLSDEQVELVEEALFRDDSNVMDWGAVDDMFRKDFRDVCRAIDCVWLDTGEVMSYCEFDDAIFGVVRERYPQYEDEIINCFLEEGVLYDDVRKQVVLPRFEWWWERVWGEFAEDALMPLCNSKAEVKVYVDYKWDKDLSIKENIELWKKAKS